MVCVYFVRRQPLLNMVSGGCALLPLTAARSAGFTWADGLTAAQQDFSERVGPALGDSLGLLGMVVLVVACGPTIAASAGTVRRTPAWPFLVGAAVLPLAVGGRGRPRARRGHPNPAPVWLVALGAAGAVVLQAVLRTAW